MIHVPSSARLTPVSARGKRSRERLIRAAEHVFGDNGFEDTSIAEICRVAGCALGSFYVYFPDKRHAFVELVDSLGARLRSTLTRAVARLGERDRLSIERAGLRAFFGFLSKHRKLYRIVRQAEFVDAAAFRRYYEQLERSYVAGLRRAMKRGEIRAIDPVVTSYCLMGISDFLGMRLAVWDAAGEEKLDHLVESAMQFIEHGLAVDREKGDAETRDKHVSSRRPRALPTTKPQGARS
jgi:AcrR family transcriptional regulator